MYSKIQMKKEDVVVEKVFMYKDYFSLFKLNQSFFINIQTLEKNYIALQSKHHPDLFFLKSEKKLALDNIAEINKAYQTLKSSITRAEYLLEIKRVIANTDDVNNIIKEVFTLSELDDVDIQYHILLCTKAMENAFLMEDFKEAAKQLTKLKYIKKIQEDRGIS
ncbi:Fe-S protein assembly co-chaperone HscB [Ehrlichia ruminantium]|nr:Fe-S protein assembly co-chaperone HscB [Ehrlichia ruminantium]QLK54174.1 Fe-S protein assembly co-chaperone HscB [Ehrlichia ruminantium]QLK56926.1 Fe-S protein assembly co-chaperone HscB [Ehrlichia ruminantium]QLK57840.1 Fe-S protein assembly co-chaperone HscB [Ehrlichia ruminantium]UOD98292.1 Fe-S protein assembly co-chaperone HscB [Ehrlichia ruminantium]